MTSFLLPAAELLPSHVADSLPEEWDGQSQSLELARLWSSYKPGQPVYHKLYNQLHPNEKLKLLWEGTVLTFPEWGLQPEDWWSFESANSFDETVYLMHLCKKFGNIIENGYYDQMQETSAYMQELADEVGHLLPENPGRLNIEVASEGFSLLQYLKKRGVLMRLKQVYPLMLHAKATEVIKLLAVKIPHEKFLRFAHIGATTYQEIYTSDGRYSVANDWLNMATDRSSTMKESAEALEPESFSHEP